MSRTLPPFSSLARFAGLPRRRCLLAALLLAFLAALLALGPPARAAELELIMFQTPECPWCQAWEAEVGVIYAKTPEGRRAPLRRVDIYAPPPDLDQVNGIYYTPTFVLLAGGREVGRILGYPGEAYFWTLLGEFLDRQPTPPDS